MRLPQPASGPYALTLAERRESLSQSFRRKRVAVFLPLIEAAFRRTGQCRIIDLGGRANYWDLFDRTFLEANKVHVTTVNLETPEGVSDPMFTEIQGDTLSLPKFADQAFDIAHSNSVIEHHPAGRPEVQTWVKPCAMCRAPACWTRPRCAICFQMANWLRKRCSVSPSP